jgi:hypothetical protein
MRKVLKNVAGVLAVAGAAIGTMGLPAQASTRPAEVSVSGAVHVTRHHVSWERVTVRELRCVTDVQAYVISADGQDETFSAVSHAHGRAVTVKVPFSNLSEGGTWHVSSVFVTPCDSDAWRQITPADVRFIVRH